MEPTTSLQKRPGRLLWGAAAAVCLLSVFRLARVLPNYSCLDQASGVWTAMAIDLAHGTFYRPLISDAGYGGTRYFPLHFVIHAGLIKIGIDPIVAGCAIAIGSAILLIAGLYTLMRRLGVGNSLAMPASVLPIVTEAGQMGISMIRGDLLPAALTVWGLACIVNAANSDALSASRTTPGEEGSGNGNIPRNPSVAAGTGTTGNAFAAAGKISSTPSLRDSFDCNFQSIALASLLFVLAFSAKSTTLFGPMAACAMLWLSGRKTWAAQLAAMVGLGAAAFILTTNWLSDGRFLSVLRACAAADADLQTLATAPAALLRLELKADPSSLSFMLLAVVALLALPGAAWRELPTLFFFATGAISILIFGSPGVFVNHLIDWQGAAVVFFVVQISRKRIPEGFATLALACAAFLSVGGTAQALQEADNLLRRDNFTHTLAAVHQQAADQQASGRYPAADFPRPVLYEHPLLAVVDGQTPYMLDPFMFAVARANRPALRSDLWAKLRNHYFSAIVLMHDPANLDGRFWFDINYFGPGFADAVLAHYQRAKAPGSDYFVFVPKTDQATASSGQ